MNDPDQGLHQHLGVSGPAGRQEARANRLALGPESLVRLSSFARQGDAASAAVGGMPLSRHEATFLQENEHGANRIRVGRGPSDQLLLRDPILFRKQGEENELVGGRRSRSETRLRAAVHRPVRRSQSHRNVMPGRHGVPSIDRTYTYGPSTAHSTGCPRHGQQESGSTSTVKAHVPAGCRSAVFAILNGAQPSEGSGQGPRDRSFVRSPDSFHSGQALHLPRGEVGRTIPEPMAGIDQDMSIIDWCRQYLRMYYCTP